MRFLNMEHIVLKLGFRSLETYAVHVDEGDTVEGVGGPNLLDNNVGVQPTAEVGIGVGDAVHVDVEEGIHETVLAIV